MLDTTNTTPKFPTFSQAKASGLAWLAANPAALEVEYTISLSDGDTMQIWVHRDGTVRNRSRYAEAV